jgi:hypothetical protein
VATCFGPTSSSSGNTIRWNILHSARLCQYYSLMCTIIILNFGILRRSDLFLSSVCPFECAATLVVCTLYWFGVPCTCRIFLQWLFQPIQGPGLLFSSMIIFTGGRTPCTSDQPVTRPLPKHRTTQTQNKRVCTLNIHALNGIRTHDPSVRVTEDSSCLRPSGHCHRPRSVLVDPKYHIELMRHRKTQNTEWRLQTVKPQRKGRDEVEHHVKKVYEGVIA